jgi:tetratricopeptide (TPR) repeat protein
MRAGSANIAAIYADAERALAQRDYRGAHAFCIRILELDPGNARAYFLLGILAGDHGNIAKALELMDRAIGFDAGVSRYHAHRARYLLALQRVREAYEAAVRAQALGPSDGLTFDTVGVVLSRVGAHEEAVAPFSRAVERSPGNPSYQYNLGAALQFAGDFAGAERAYRAALAADPSAYRAWSSLAQLKPAPFSEEELGALERALEGALEVDAELHVCHALAKHYEDIGGYERAFAYLGRGKRRKRATLHYSFAEDERLFAAARQAADAPLRGAGHASNEPIFIVGMPRTGTTLVERILSSHPYVFSAGELMNFGLTVKRMTATRSNRVLDEETLYAAVSLDRSELGRRYVESTRPRTGKTPRFIDKLPLNFFYVDLIRRALPHAKIICLRRNKFDTCLSNYRQLFATNFSYYDYAYDLLDTGRFYLAFDALVQHWTRSAGTSFTEVRYEDLVEHTEREARRLVEFCGLEWTAACLEFHSNAAPVATASSVQVREPIYRKAVGRWRSYEAQLEPLRRLLGGAAWHAADEN